MRRREGPRGPPVRPSTGYRRYRGHGTGDKRAMISVDTSSEGSVDHTPPAYIKQVIVNTNRHFKTTFVFYQGFFIDLVKL